MDGRGLSAETHRNNERQLEIIPCCAEIFADSCVHVVCVCRCIRDNVFVEASLRKCDGRSDFLHGWIVLKVTRCGVDSCP